MIHTFSYHTSFFRDKLKRHEKMFAVCHFYSNQAETLNQPEVSPQICSAAAAAHTAIRATDILVAPREAALPPVRLALLSRSGRRQTAGAPVNRLSCLPPRATVALWSVNADWWTSGRPDPAAG